MMTQTAEPETTTAPGNYCGPREGAIFAAMSAVMAAIRAVGKNHRNEAQNFYFRSIDDVYAAAQPALVEQGVFCTPRMLSRKTVSVTSGSGATGSHHMIQVEFEFCAADGSSVRVVVPGEASDWGDKGLSKAMSAAYKYAIFQTFCVPIAENGQDRDPDYTTPPDTQQAPAASAPPPATGRVCPKCGKALKLREPKPGGKQFTPFYGCTGWKKDHAGCDYTEPVDGKPAAEPPPAASGAARVCPECGKPMRLRTKRDGKGKPFWGCTGYPNCKHTEQMDGDDAAPAAAPAVSAPKADQAILAEIGEMCMRLGDQDKAKAATQFAATATEHLGRTVTASEAHAVAAGLTADQANAIRTTLSVLVATSAPPEADEVPFDRDDVPEGTADRMRRDMTPPPEIPDEPEGGANRATVLAQARRMAEWLTLCDEHPDEACTAVMDAAFQEQGYADSAAAVTQKLHAVRIWQTVKAQFDKAANLHHQALGGLV